MMTLQATGGASAGSTGDAAEAEQQSRLPGTKSALSRHQVEILRKCSADAEVAELMIIAERTDRTKFRNQVLKPLLVDGLLEMTIPDKPTSSKQRYRTTERGRSLLGSLTDGAA